MENKYLILASLLFIQLFLLSPLITAQADSLIILTAEEKVWLAENPVIRIGVDPNFLPYDGVDENSVYVGIGADYLKLIEEKIDISFELIPNLGWLDVLEGLRNKSVMLSPVITQTPERQVFTDFTDPYVSFQDVIFARDDNTDIKTVEDLTNKKVALVEQYATTALLTELNPDIIPFFVPSELEGLKAISLGDADAYVGFLATSAYISKQNAVTNVKVVGEVKGSEGEFRMGVQKGQPELVSILNKALDRITQEEKDEILDKWIDIEFEAGLSTVAKIVIGSGTTLLIIFIIFTIILIRQLQAIKKVEASLVESEEKYKAIYESSADAIMVLDPFTGKFSSGNPATIKMFKVKNEEEFIKLGPRYTSPEKQPNGRKSIDMIKEAIAKTMSEGSNFFEWTHKRLDGKLFYATVLLTRFKLKGKDILQATVRDISEKKKAEEMMKKSIEELERFKDLTVGRELKMIELKKEMRELGEKKKIGEREETKRIVVKEETKKLGDEKK